MLEIYCLFLDIFWEILSLTSKAFWYANSFTCNSVFLWRDSCFGVLLPECLLKGRKEGRVPGKEGRRCWNLKSKCQSSRPWLLGKLTDRTCIFLKVLLEWLGVQIANKNPVQGDELRYLLGKRIISSCRK